MKLQRRCESRVTIFLFRKTSGLEHVINHLLNTPTMPTISPRNSGINLPSFIPLQRIKGPYFLLGQVGIDPQNHFCQRFPKNSTLQVNSQNITLQLARIDTSKPPSWPLHTSHILKWGGTLHPSVNGHVTHPKTNMSPQKRPFWKECILPSYQFRGVY